MPAPLPPPDCQRETRLGLVVYGGVALAVYMNGVCREFYDATRGRGVYKLFKALTDSDIVVDIISGTSAGGINGVLLSYALTNSRDDAVVDFANFADIWRESGDINQLLRQPCEGQAEVDSLLDGEGYYQDQLEAAFRNNAQPTPAPAGEWRSPSGELDLFVTGTDTLGRVYTALDDTGAAIEVKDHRAIFQLKHRPGRKEPFAPAPDTFRALAKLCRITSCFPAAFPVVSVQIDDQASPADRLLVTWGQLDQRWLPAQPPPDGYRLHFVDGGVLDNRPFSYALEAIYYRTANRPVERKLFYIDPSPDRFSGSKAFCEMPRPTIWQAVQDSLVGIPSYESISGDLEAIARHNETVRRYRTLLDNIEAEVDAVTEEPVAVREDLYQLSRFVSLRDRALPLILGLESSRVAVEEGNQRQTALAAVAKLLYAPARGTAANPQAVAVETEEVRSLSIQVLDLDVEYLIRKHFYAIRKLRQRAESPELAPATAKTLQLLAERLNRQLRLLEILRSSLRSLLVHSEVVSYFSDLAREAEQIASGTPAAIALRERLQRRLLQLHQFWFSPDREGATGCLASLLDRFAALPEQAASLTAPDYQRLDSSMTNWLPQDELSALARLLQQRLAELPPGAIAAFLAAELPPAKQPVSLLGQLDRSLQAILETTALPEALRDYARNCGRHFRNLDRKLYPFEYLAGVSEKQLIATVRISPEDAQRGFGRGKGVANKLAGDSLHAFGGFFKKSWRANDILWGRLDGLNRLADGLLTREATANFPHFVERQLQQQDLTTRVYLERLLAEALPAASDAARAELLPTLEQLAQAPELVSEAEFDRFLDQLVQAGQQAILNSSLPAVVQDAIAEQLTWQQQKVSLDGELPQYLPAKGYFNRTVSAAAAAQLARQAFCSPEATPAEGLAAFFAADYRVGQEELLADLPEALLKSLAARSLLVLRDILNTLFQAEARGWSRRLTYRLANSTLQLAHWWLGLQSPLPPPRRAWQQQLRHVLRGLGLVGAIALVAILVARYSPAWLSGLVLALLLARALGLGRWLRL